MQFVSGTQLCWIESDTHLFHLLGVPEIESVPRLALLIHLLVVFLVFRVAESLDRNGIPCVVLCRWLFDSTSVKKLVS